MGLDVTLPQDRLEAVLRAAGRAVSGRAPQPVLAGLLLKAGEGRLSAAGYDLALGVRSEVPAVVAEAGSVVAPSRMLAALVGTLPAGSMVRLLDLGTGALAIEAGEGRYSVALSHEPEDFPVLPTIATDEPIGLPFGQIKRALNAVLYACSKEECHMILQGVQFCRTGTDLRFTGGVNPRSSIFELPGILETGKDASFVIPGLAVKELLKLGLADDDLLLISHTDSFACFDASDTVIITNLIAGAYPPFYTLIPSDCSTEIICDRQATISAIERVAIVANAETGKIAFTYNSKTGDVSISVANDAGSAADLIATETGSKGEDFSVVFNSSFILDALRHAEAKLVSISFNENKLAKNGLEAKLIKVSPVGMLLHNQLLATIRQPTT
jgi:DNA polymerase-3 subunit beta